MDERKTNNATAEISSSGGFQTATLAGGCFWCTEAIFQRLTGVEKVVSGYAGGKNPSPSYEDVSYNNQGEVEAVQITFDPDTISYAKLLEILWQIHDPTTPNQQGNDHGPQYSSVVFYHNSKQKEIAEAGLKLAQPYWQNKIVTELLPLERFLPAEDYHQDYYNSNTQVPYCQLVINPKLQKFTEKYREYLKTS